MKQRVTTNLCAVIIVCAGIVADLIRFLEVLFLSVILQRLYFATQFLLSLFRNERDVISVRKEIIINSHPFVQPS